MDRRGVRGYRPAMSRSLLVVVGASLLLTGCPTEPPPRAPEDFGEASRGDDPVPIGTSSKKEEAAAEDAAPEISRSRGPKGGVVVLWPRVWPKSDDATTRDLATKVQQRLQVLAKRAAGARTVELRPEPERACPKKGCEATAVSAVVVVRDKACAVVAFASGPGTSPGHLLPWAGKVELASDVVPFREPPEERVKVVDHVPCATVLDGVDDADAALARYIAGLLPGH